MVKFVRLALVVIVVGLAGLAFYMMNRTADVPASVESRHVVDSTGTELDIPVHPQRVVFLNVSNLDMFVTAGGLDKVVARPTSSSYPDDLLASMKERDIPEIGIIHSPNIEQILALKPDLVVGVNVPFHNLLRPVLAASNIPLYINTLDSYESLMNTLSFFGELTGTPEVAAAKGKEIAQDVEAAVAKNNGRPPQKALIMFGSPDNLNMSTSASFSGDLLKRLGGENIADVDTSIEGSYVPLSIEYVVKNDPDIIFIIAMGVSTDVMKTFREDMRENDKWRDVTAVKNNNVHVLPGRLFTVNPGSHIVEAINIMAGMLYPEGGK